MKRLAMAVAIAGLAFPAAAAAHLPIPDHLKIVPGKSMGEVRLGMKEGQVKSHWGPPSKCFADTCQWTLPHNPANGERATVAYQDERVRLISIQAGRKHNGAFKPGFLSQWKTNEGHIHLGTPKEKVEHTFGRASDPGVLWTNDSIGVGGFDYFLDVVDKGARTVDDHTTATRFSTPGAGPTPNRLWGISLSWACRPGPCAPIPENGAGGGALGRSHPG
jgi:hypothetical protein